MRVCCFSLSYLFLLLQNYNCAAVVVGIQVKNKNKEGATDSFVAAKRHFSIALRLSTDNYSFHCKEQADKENSTSE